MPAMVKATVSALHWASGIHWQGLLQDAVPEISEAQTSSSRSEGCWMLCTDSGKCRVVIAAATTADIIFAGLIGAVPSHGQPGHCAGC